MHSTPLVAFVLLSVLSGLIVAQVDFGPRFEIGRYDVTEGQNNLCVRLSEPILNSDFFLTGPGQNIQGKVEVDVCFEDGTELPIATRGLDYSVCSDLSADRFTVEFLVGQDNSTTVCLCIGDDNIFEDSEHFELRICAVRFPQELSFFNLVQGFDSVSVPVEIDDNDVVNIKWVLDSVSVTEGVNRTVGLRAESSGIFARPIAIGIACSPVIATNVIPANRGSDWNVTQTKLQFSDTGRLTALSDVPLTAVIVDDDVAEPRESFICNLQSGNADDIKAVPPTQITVSILDNDELVISWERDFYRFRESESANVALVTDSRFDTDVNILGFPVQITEGITELILPGPFFGIFGHFNATINLHQFRGLQYGVARVADRNRLPDVVSTFKDFFFTSVVKRSAGSFAIVDDSILEFDELFRAEFGISSLVEDGWKARKGQFPIAYIAIEDDDAVEVNFKESSYRVNESAGMVKVSLVITGQFFKNVSATVECVEGNATDPEDWEVATTYTVGFNLTVQSDRTAPRQTAESDPICLIIKNDILPEGDEVFFCRIISTSDAARVIIGPRNEVPVTIIDRAICMYEKDRYVVNEEDGYVEVALVLSTASTFPISVALNTHLLLDPSVGAAASEVDFLGIERFILTFPPGVTRVPYNITIIDDIIPEPSEFFNCDVNLVSPEDASFLAIGTPKQPLIEILDTDATANISLSSRTYSIFENETRVVVTLTLTEAYSQDIPVTVQLAGLSDIAVLEQAIAGVDYLTDGFPREITIPAGQTSFSFPILVNNEGIVEQDEKFLVSFSYTAGQPGVTVTPGFDQATVTIWNDDDLRVQFEREVYSVREDAREVMVKIIATSTASFDYEVDITLSDINAIFGLDYGDGSVVGSGSGIELPEAEPGLAQLNLTRIITAGSSMSSFGVAILDDDIYEGLESFHINLTISEYFQSMNILEGNPIVSRVDIEDEDIISVHFDPANYEVREGENKVLILLANRTFHVPFDINVGLFDSTAVAPGDYEDRDYVVSFDVQTQMGMLIVHANDDMILEDPEMFLARLTIPSQLERVVEGVPSEAKITIIDRTPAEVFFDPTMYPIDEGEDANLILKLTREVATGVTIVVQFVTQNGTAGLGEDYIGEVYNVTFDGSNIATVPVPSVDDDLVEGVEEFTAVIRVPNDTQREHLVTRGSPDTATVEINDNDMLMVFFDRERYSVSEDAGVATVTVRSSKPHRRPYTIIVFASDGTAKITEDYRGNRFEITFPAGSQSVPFDIPIVDDDVFEGLEFFNLSIVVPEAAEDLGVVPGMPVNAFVDIEDDDGVNVYFDPDTYNVTEGERAVITVRADGEFAVPFDVIVTLHDGSAVAPGDYDSTQSPYTVTFQPGQPTQTFAVPTRDDDTVEMTEVFNAVLQDSRTRGVNVIEPDEATVNIFDNDGPLEVTIGQNVTVTEGDTASIVVDVSSTDYEFDFTVTLTDMEGTAKRPRDYEAGPYTVTFTAGQASATLPVPTEDDSIAELSEYFQVMITSTSTSMVIVGDPDTSFVTIEDDDVITCSKAPDNATVTEGQVASLTVVCSGDYEFDFTLTLTHMDGSAVSPGDYTPGPYSLPFSAGQESAILTISTLDDSIAELDEVFKVMITGSDQRSKVQIVEPDTCYITIQDNDEITCNFSQPTYSVTEGDSVSITIMTSSAEFSFPFTVTLSYMDGSAVQDVDYTPGTITVDFAPGESSKTFNVATIEDDRVEKSEDFKIMKVETSQPDKVSPGSPDMVTVEIVDDDVRTLSISPQNYTVVEGQKVNITLMLDSDAYDCDFNVTLQHMDGRATAPGDYMSGPYTVTFHAGEKTAILMVTTEDDSIPELTEDFKVMITSTSEPSIVVGDPDTSYVTVLDNDEITCSFSQATYSVNEGDSASVTIMISSAEFTFPFTVTLSYMDGSAVQDVDYTPETFTVDFAPGEISKTFDVATIEDNRVEKLEDFKIMKVGTSQPDKVSPGSPDMVTVEIVDDDVRTLSISPQNYTVVEGQKVNITLMLDSDAYDCDFNVTLQHMDGRATAPGDYMSGPYTVTFRAGEKMAILMVTTEDDSIPELTEDFTVMITSTSEPNIVVGDPNTSYVTILDNDEITCSFSQATHSVTEGDSVSITIMISSAEFTFPFTVTLSYMDGSAVQDVDYTPETFTVDFAPGEASKTFDVATIEDDRVEKLEDFKIMKVGTSQPDKVSPGSPDMVTVEIVDDDVRTLSISPQNYTVVEGQKVNITLELDSDAYDCDFNVTLQHMDGSATAPGDYMSGPYTVTFLAGEKTAILMVTTEDDSIAELTEIFKVMITSTSEPSIVIADPDTSYVTILDNDVITCSKAPQNTTVTEGEVASLTVVCSGDYEFDFTLTLTHMDGSAVAPGDYTPGPYSLPFSAGEGSAILTISTLDDSIAELDEVFKVMITGSDQPTKVQIVEPDTCYVTIEDDNDAVTCNKAPENATVTEGEVASLTVVCSGDYEFDFTLTLTHMDGSAVAPGDYTPGPYSLPFSAGQGSAILNVSTIDDSIAECDQVFKVMITGSDQPTKVQIAEPDTCYVTIEDDNDVITCRKAPQNVTVTEGELVNVTVICSGEYEFDFTLNLTTMDGTAVAPGDYTPGILSLPFTTGQSSGSVSVATIDDAVIELEEYFKIMIIGSTKPSKVVIVDPDTCFISVRDNEGLSCFFSQSTYSVTEGDSVSITIMTSSAEFSFPFTVTLSYMDGSAVQDVDYTPGTITVDFAPGEISKTFDVATIEDDRVERLEDFKIMKVGASEPDKVSPGSPDMVTVEIVDDDVLEVMFSPDDYNVSEGEVATVTLITNLPYTFDFPVTVVCENGSAVAPEDFAGGEYNVTFMASPNAPGRSSVQVPTSPDMVFEDLEFFRCVLVIPPMDTDNVEKGEPDMARVNITDSTGADCFFNPDVYLVDEGQNATLRVETSVTVAKRFSCIVTTFDDSATSPSDYMSGTRVAIFEVGSTSATVTYSTVQDDVREGLEMFRATLTVSEAMQDMGVRVEEPDTAVVDIRDDEELFVMFSRTMYTVTEGDPPANISVNVTLIATRGCEDEYTVNVTALDGSALEGEDYRGQSFPVTFPPLTTSMSFLVPVISDDVFEPDEAFTLQLEAPQNMDGMCRDVRLGNPDRATIIIRNDDSVNVFFDPDTYNVTEGETAVITLRADSNFTVPFDVNVTLRDGSAVAPGDYDSTQSPYTVTFQPGQLTRTIAVPTRDDDTVEMTEVFNAVLQDSPTRGVNVIEPDEATVNIFDNDGPLEVTIGQNVTVTEGDTASIVVDVSSTDYEFDFTVTLTDMEGTAEGPGDYEVGPYTVTFTAGQASATLPVPTENDSIAELSEYFQVMITSTSTGMVIVGDPDTSFVTIEDDDGLSCFFSQPTYSVTEGDSVSITIMTSSAEFSFPFTVTLSYMDGSAVQDEDYTPGTISVDFAPGETSKTFDIATIEDDRVERLEDFKIMKVGTSEPDKVSPGSPDMVTVEIVDDDVLEVMFSPDDYEVSEGEVATVTLVTNLPYTFDFPVTVVCENGSAVAPEDFAGGEYNVTFMASPNAPGRSSVQVPTSPDMVFEDLEFFRCVLVIPPMDTDNVEKGEPDMARVNITDNTGADCFFNPDVYLVDEGQNATLRVETSVTVAKRFSCIVTTSDDSATSPSDYMSGTRVAIFEVGSTSATVTYSTVQDDVREGLETFRATLTASEAMQAMGVRVEEPDTAVVDIRDDEELFVMFSRTMYMISEGDPPGDVLVNVTLIATRGCEDEYTVNVIASDGSALEGEDYRGQSFPVTFPPLTTSMSFLVPVISDDVFEPDEAFTLQLEAPQNMDGMCRDVRLGNPDRATIIIRNDDSVNVFFDPDTYNVTEGETAFITLRADSNFTVPFDVNVTLRDGSAVAPGDYDSTQSPYTVTFQPGQLTQTFAVPTRDDDTVEMTEVFNAVLQDSPTRGVNVIEPDEATVNIFDNDGPLEVTIGQNVTVAEGDTASIVVNVSSTDYEFDFTVTLTDMEGTAKGPRDYEVGPYTVTFTAGQASATLPVPTENDSIAELSEYFKVMITSTSTSMVIVGAPNTSFVTIEDDDVITCSKAPENVTVTEGEVASLTVVCSGDYEFDFTLTLTHMDGSAVAPGDYTPGPYSLPFSAGEGSAILTVSTLDDSIAELDEVFKVMITGSDQPSKVQIVEPDTCYVTIEDDNDVITCSKAPENATVTEGEVASLTVVCSGDYEFNFTLALTHMDGSAVAPGDYTPGPYSLPFSAGEGSAILTVSTLDDSIAECDEVFKVMITGSDQPSKVQIVEPDTCYVTIEDDNDVITCRKVPQNVTVTEGELVNVTVICSGEYEFDFTLNLTTMDGTAVAPGDYTPGILSLPFTSGQSSGSVSVATIDDAVIELEEYFKIMIAGSTKPSKVVIVDPDTCFISVRDNEGLSCFFSQPTYSVTEGDSVSITIMTSSTEFSFPFTVTLSYMDGSAEQNVDYTPVTFTVDFAPGEISKTFDVATIEDDRVEELEDFKIMKVGTSEPDKVSPGSPDMVTVEIVDDDVLEVMFSPDDYEVSEGEVATVTLVTNLPYTFDFPVTVVCENGSAVAPEDFAGGEYNVTFMASPNAPGRSSVQVPTSPDMVFEDLEFFRCVLVIPPMDTDNVVKGEPDMARVNITDNTGADCFFNPDVYLVDEGQNVTLTVETSVTVAKRFSCIVTTSDDSATSPSDYMSGTRVAIFEVGSTSATVTYSTVPDDVREGLETFRATLTVSEAMQDMGVRVEEPDTAVVDIRDDEELFVMFSRTMYVVTEGDPPGDVLVNVTLIATRGCEDEYTVNVIASDGTALEGEDYRGQSFPVTFPPLTTSMSFLVPVISDDVFEPDEAFTLQLEAPQNMDRMCRDVRLGNPDRATIIIRNDEPVITVGIEKTTLDVVENEDKVEVCLVKSGPSSLPIMAMLIVEETTVSGSSDNVNAASENDDFNPVPVPEKLTIPGNMTRMCFDVLIRDDPMVERTEPFKITVVFPPDQPALQIGEIQASSSTNGTINIQDDDDITVQFERRMYMSRESEGPFDVKIIASGNASFPYTIQVAAMNIEATQPFDYVFSPIVLTFQPDEVEKSITVPIVDDIFDELDETFKLIITVPNITRDAGITEGEINVTTLLIVDDDVPTAVFDPQNYTVPEGSPVNITVVLDKTPAKECIVAVTTMDLTAESPSDYTSVVREEVVFQAGQRSAVFSIPTSSDGEKETSEVFKVTNLTSTDSECVVGTPDEAFVTIVDESDITVQFERDMYMAFERDGMVDVRIISSSPASFPYDIMVSAMDIEAVAPDDYNFPDMTITFAPGDTTKTLSIPIFPDMIDERDETFKLTITIPEDSRTNGVVEGSPIMTVVLIKDSDVPTVRFDPQNYTVPEGSPANITVVVDMPPATECRVTVTTMDLTAESSSDYTSIVRELVIPAGQTSATFPVDTLKDILLEDSEHFKVVLTSVNEDCAIGTPDESFVTIVDQTVEVVVKFNPDTYLVKEGEDDNAVIQLEAMGEHGFEFTVLVRSMDGSARITDDYEGDLFPVVFPANVNMASFNLSIVDDEVAECMENLTLILEVPEAEADKGVLRGSPDVAVVDILDDDVADLLITFVVADHMVKENVGTVTVGITASRSAAFDYNVTVRTVADSAISPDDFEDDEFTVAFPAGSTQQSVDVVITDDNIVEQMESLSLELSISDDLISKGVQIGSSGQAVIRIMDNDVAVKFRRSEVSVTEEDGQAPVEVLAMGDLSMDFSIIVMAINGTAIENLDFTGNMWPLDFPASSTRQGFRIAIIQDAIVEDAELFRLKIVVSDELSRRLTVTTPDMMNIIITDMTNDTVRGDPLFTVPLPSLHIDDENLKGAGLCYEYHGISGQHYNLISDQCVSVNTLFSSGLNKTELNVMSEIGILSEDTNGSCHSISVVRDGCVATFDGTQVTNSVSRGGLTVTVRRNRIRVSLPNCEPDKRLVLWLFCNRRNEEDMLELVVSRGDGLQPTAHGLIGQFWNVPIGVEPYIGPFGAKEVDKDDDVYLVTVSYPGSQNRTFIAELHRRAWVERIPCLYAGNSMAGPIAEVPQYKDNVIDGALDSYSVKDLFSPEFEHSKYKSSCN